MNDCLFCKIIAGDIPSNKVYEDEQTLAFRDIAPQAPVHILVIPKKHITSWYAAKDEDDALLAHMMRTVSVIAEQEGVSNSGFRVVSNVGSDAKQSVPQFHLHLLAGKPLSEGMA